MAASDALGWIILNPESPKLSTLRVECVNGAAALTYIVASDIGTSLQRTMRISIFCTSCGTVPLPSMASSSWPKMTVRSCDDMLPLVAYSVR